MEYEGFNFKKKSDIKRMLQSTDRDVKIGAIVGMINGINDWVWLQNTLLEYINDKDFWVAKNAITGLGDVARIYRKLDISKVKTRLNEVTNNELTGVIENTIDDLDIFIKVV